MATRKRVVPAVDYAQFNSMSSVILFDTSKRKRSKFYEAERIIERRNKGQNYEYLIKWKYWPMECSSWEPSEHLNAQLLRSYVRPPTPSDETLQEASRQFVLGVLSALKSNSLSPVYVHIQLHVWRYVCRNEGQPSAHRGHLLMNKNDFHRLKFLPESWWYLLDENGEGKAIEFPIKVKPVLSWSPKGYMLQAGRLCSAPRLPQERLKITVLKRPFSVNSGQ